ATFQGDGTQTCASAGLCGYSGTVTYTFANPRGGFAIVTVQTRGHRHAGFGDLEFGADGTTTSNVTEAGVAQPCTDTVKHRGGTLKVDADYTLVRDRKAERRLNKG